MKQLMSNYGIHATGNVNRKTVTMTFRLDESIVNKRRNEANYREVSLNTLVNQVLKRFVEWDVFESKVGMIPIAKPLVIKLFESMTEDEIVGMANSIGKNAAKDIALFMKNKIDIYSFLSWFELRMKNSSAEIKHEVEKDNTHVYIVRHNLGKNWSLNHKIVLELIFNDLIGQHIHVTTSATTFSFKFQD